MDGEKASEHEIRTNSEHDVATRLRYQRFLNANYSSKAFLFVILAYFLFSEFIFPDYAVLSSSVESVSINLATYISMALRFVVFCFVAIVWFSKTTDGSPPCKWIPQQLVVYLPIMQGLYPLLMNIAFSLYILCEHFACAEQDRPKLNDSADFLAIVGLKGYPLVTFMLLRDTDFTAILASFWLGVIVHLIVAISSGSHRELVTFCAYSVTTGVILYDSHRQNRAAFSLVSTLQNTLIENERLAVQAQALELRAMIGNVAHDLKTPLTSTLSAVECMTAIVKDWQSSMDEADETLFLAKAPGNFAALRSCLKSMESINSFMTMTINRCVDYTKASKGFKLEPRYQTVCLKTKIELAVQMINDMHSSINIIEHPWSNDICSHIITDRQWFVENMLCLLSNAVKYSHRGNVDVFVSLEDNPNCIVGSSDQAAAATQLLRVEVQDAGVGLSEEAMASLFNPFKQAQRMAGGTGLGLYSLARRVEALKGQYGVSGRPDGTQGSLFWFSVPYRPDKLSADNTNVLAGTKGTATATSNSALIDAATVAAANAAGLNVMVVDDAPLIVKMTTALLKQKGHRVTEQAVNGADALEKLLGIYRSEYGSPPFDAVLMDLQMPVLDGIETIRRLRAAEQGMRAAPAAPFAEQAPETARSDGPPPGLPPGPQSEMLQGALPEALQGADASAGGRPAERFHQYVIALSANSDNDTQQAALDAGADAFLAKPFTYDAFMKLMLETG